MGAKRNKNGRNWRNISCPCGSNIKAKKCHPDQVYWAGFSRATYTRTIKKAGSDEVVKVDVNVFTKTV